MQGLIVTSSMRCATPSGTHARIGRPIGSIGARSSSIRPSPDTAAVTRPASVASWAAADGRSIVMRCNVPGCCPLSCSVIFAVMAE